MRDALYLYLSGIIILSGLDCVLTIVWIQSGAAVELNPIMNLLLQVHPLLFASVKILLVSGGVTILWYFQGKRFVLPGTVIAFICYLFVFLYHVNGFLTYMT